MKCPDCENCRWAPKKDCGLAEHPHCERCGHCMGRHGPWMISEFVDARTIHHTMPEG